MRDVIERATFVGIFTGLVIGLLAQDVLLGLAMGLGSTVGTALYWSGKRGS